eukprot:GHVH01006597.1.p1 GENE.GHVH01006597.1~~GHVH01006597.1.p1  ORF type:complete len:165 (-),score=12.26 GHVH01006597.1:1048-1542(-)
MSTPTTLSFFEALETKIDEKKSFLCVGVDPHKDDLVLQLQRMGHHEIPDKLEDIARIALAPFCHDMLEKTHKYVTTYKPNSAFFEQYGEFGISMLREFIKAVHEKDCLVILDFKRGDIGSTALAYANFAYDVLEADAITVCGYMGNDCIDAFRRVNKAIFALCA